MEETDLAGIIDVGAAAKLSTDGRLPYPHHTHHIAVFLIEQRGSASGDGLFIVHLLFADGQVFTYLIVNDQLDGFHLIRGHGGEVGKIEP